MPGTSIAQVLGCSKVGERLAALVCIPVLTKPQQLAQASSMHLSISN